MKKFTIQAILLIIIVTAGFLFYFGGFAGQPFPFLPLTPVTRQLMINSTTINVEIADTADKRNKGLGGRESLASDSGMLFLFDKPDRYPFWMKGMHFALDFIWINGSQVADLSQNVPAPAANAPDSALTIFSAGSPIDKVLEVPAGTIKNLNVKVGDSVQLQ